MNYVLHINVYYACRNAIKQSKAKANLIFLQS
ncbi:hypothetical protein KCP78_08755 [Salmonella enterica subsp. enterica]|nr:hypothetical protein KCP78_08755 [Salmonella enterica subsp. enterica]